MNPFYLCEFWMGVAILSMFDAYFESSEISPGRQEQLSFYAFRHIYFLAILQLLFTLSNFACWRNLPETPRNAWVKLQFGYLLSPISFGWQQVLEFTGYHHLGWILRPPFGFQASDWSGGRVGSWLMAMQNPEWNGDEWTRVKHTNTHTHTHIYIHIETYHAYIYIYIYIYIYCILCIHIKKIYVIADSPSLCPSYLEVSVQFRCRLAPATKLPGRDTRADSVG